MPRGQPQLTEAQEPLYQMWVDESHPRWGKRELPVGPKMQRRMFGPLLEAINRAIIDGSEKQWKNPRLLLCPGTISPPDSPFTREDRQNDRVGGYRSETLASTSLSLN